jgi:hypothetical protein
MALLNQSFDAAELPQSTSSFEPIPEGSYNATISQSELRNTNDGTGQYIKLRLDITGPSHQGRVVFANLNIKNQSQKAEEIGRQQLGEIMRAIGLSKLQDTDQLIGGAVNIKLAIRPARTDERTGKSYDAANEVKGYRAISGAAPAASKPVAPSATAKGATPPWMK